MNNESSIERDLNSTSTDNELHELTKKSDYYLQARYRLDQILSIFIFIFGLCGNLFIILLMRRKTLAKLTVSVYLISLAISDTCVLIFDNFITWIDLLSHNFSIKKSTDCKIYFLYYISKLVSSWIIVSISIDRFLLIYFSNNTKKYITKTSCLIRVIGIIFVSICVNLHLAFLIRAPDNKDYHCISIDSEAAEYWNELIWPIIETFIYSLIPSILLIVLNLLIIFKSRKSKANFKLWAKPVRNSVTSTIGTSTNSEYITKKINITVFAICFSFICLTLPSNIFNICTINELALIDEYEKAYTSHEVTKVDSLTYERARVSLLDALLIDRILEHLMNAYHAINFILYIMTSDLFREEFFLMFKFGFKILIRKVFRKSKKKLISPEMTD